MQLLVLSPDPVGPEQIRGALPDDDLADARVLVVSPAEKSSALAFWMSDVDDAIASAEDAADRTATALREAGAQARGRAGEAEPLLALQDALETYQADRIVVFGEDEALVAEARERFGVPVVSA